MNLLKYISLLYFVLILAACSDESPLEVIEDDISEAEDHAKEQAHKDSQRNDCKNGTNWDLTDAECCSYYGYQCKDSEANKCYYGTSTYSDSYCCTYYGYRCSYVSSSSSVKSSSSYKYSSSSYVSEADKCYYGTSTKSNTYCCNNYGYRCEYVYSSSSVKTEVVEAHTSKTKTMKFSLTYYKQKSADWDGLSAGGSYSDGDPTVSFSIYFIASGGQSTSKTTGTLLSLQDQGSWSGSKTSSFEVPIGTQDIKVCPTVVDNDFSFNDNMSSGYCYTKTNIGYLTNYSSVEQSDYNSSKYELEWEWYLY
ncbi:MAG: hypothetical protein J6W06_07380 [Bacteroidales bacterium]|nr:hypothetical protein [Bacteroidales bacterium]